MRRRTPSASGPARRACALAAAAAMALSLAACSPSTTPESNKAQLAAPGSWLVPMQGERDVSAVAGAYPMKLQSPTAEGTWAYLDGATSFNAAVDRQLLAALDKHTGAHYQPAVETARQDKARLSVQGTIVHTGGHYLIGRLQITPHGPGTTAETTMVYDSATGTTVPSEALVAPAHRGELAALIRTLRGADATAPVPLTDLAFDAAGNLTVPTTPANRAMGTLRIPAAAVRPWLSTLGRHAQDDADEPWKPPAPAPKQLRHINCDIVPCAALTYDDGPSQATTPRLLKMLEQAGAGATFFAVGGAVSYSPLIARAEHDAGFTVGNHSWNHPDLRRLSPAAVATQMQWTNSAIKAATGAAPTLMRAPYGGVDAMVQQNVGLPIILWSVDSLDWLSRDPAKYIPTIMRLVSPGAVILEHDIHATTVDHQGEVISRLQNAGYYLVTVPQLFAGITLQPGQVYRCRGHGRQCTPSPGR